MSRDSLLGLDLGSTRVCALALDAEGRVRGRAHRPLGARFPGAGRVEQDPLEMERASVEVLREALAAAGLDASRIAGLGIATQRATALAWDAQSGEPLAPAIGWQDQRTAERTAELRAAGIPVSTLPSATKFEWWLRHEPRVAQAAAAGRLCLGTPDVWLTARLDAGRAFVTDPGQASCTALYELAKGDWWPVALQLFGVPHAALPALVATDAVVGETPAALLGAPVPLAARAGDQQAAAFAQGVHAPGRAKLTLGTAAILDVHAGAAPPPELRGAFALALWRLSSQGDAFCREGNVITAGAAVEWLMQIGVLPEAAALDALAGRVPDSDGVVFVPAFQGLGTPWLDERVRGQLGGLTRGSTAAHVVRAVVDGIAQRCADLCDALEVAPGPLAVDGGLAQSGLLLQSLADLTGRPLQRAAELETTALGAALLAGRGVGLLLDAGAARSADEIAPQLGDSARAEARGRWRQLIETMRAS